MPGKANRNLAAGDGDAFVFSWARRHPGIFWLWGFLVLSVLLHATGFYLFQVVYPSSGRLEPFPAQVLILDKKNAINAALLQELDDRLVFLQPASAGSESRKGIDDFPVPFRPSFADRAPPFRNPMAPEETVEAADGSPARPRRWSLAGDLSQRTMSATRASDFDKALPSAGTGAGIVLEIVVAASGEVEQAVVKSGAQHPAAKKIIAAVREQLSFDPTPGGNPTKGEMTIRQ